MVHLVGLIRLTHVIERIELVVRSLLVHLICLSYRTHRTAMLNMVDLLHGRIVVHATLNRRRGCLRDSAVLLMTTSRIWVIVYSRVTSQLVRATEAFRTAWKLASMRFLSSMCPDMACLMFKAMESLVAERTFIWTRKVGTVVVLVLHGDSHGRHCRGRRGHRITGLLRRYRQGC